MNTINFFIFLFNIKKMQTASSMSDYIEFKNEIMKRIRLLESKFTSEFNSKFSQVSESFEKLDMKINSISQNNTSLIEYITKQNFNYEKITELEDFKIKADNELVTHDIKIKNILQEIEKLKIRYDKIINENLMVPGYVGPGGQHKNLSEYIIYQINEFQKIRNDSEQTKNRVDNAAKIALSAVNKSFAKFQNYSDEKNKNTQIMLEKKYLQFSERVLELETELNKYQYKIEKQIKPLENDIKKLIQIKNNPSFVEEQKFVEINNKINAIIDEFNLIKKNKEWDSKIINYRNTNNSTDLLNSKNTSKYNKSNYEFKNNFNTKNKQNYKSSKNVNQLYDNEQKNSLNSLNSLINKRELPKSNSDLISSLKNYKEENEYNNNINNNKEIIQEEKIINDKNDKNDKYKEDSSFNNSKKIEKIFLDKNDFKENEKINKIEYKYNEKINKIKFNTDNENLNNNNNSNNNNNNNSNNNNNNSLENEKFIKISINKNKEKDKIKYIDKGTDNDYLLHINKNMNINNTIDNSKKISINALYKNKNNSISDNLLDIKSNKIRKEDEKEYNSINSKNNTKILQIDKVENNKIEKEINEDNHKNVYNKKGLLYNEINDNENGNKNDLKKINYNINNLNIKSNNFNYNNNINILPKTSKNSFLNRNEDNLTNELLKNKKNLYNLEINEEQKEIMKKIRDYYKHKKIVMEKKLHENIVNCNIVNLNRKDSYDIINIKYKNSSAKNTFYNNSKSKINENRNNLKDISLKLSPYLRRTNYRFFSRKNISNSNDYRSFDNDNF